jgi:hypothetical protein
MKSRQGEVESIIAPLKKITPLSKYLAMVIFVASPFLGGWVGYSLALEKVIDATKVTMVNTQPPAAMPVKEYKESFLVD